MHEIELKFQIPQRARAAVQRAVATPGLRAQRLQAIYFDTAERDLARAGVAWRLRKEGRQWVQTLKAAEANAMQRLEHNVVRVLPRGTEPWPDLACHDGTPAGDRLAEVLRALPSPPVWVAQYATDIRRWARRLRGPGGTVELALDLGQIRSGERVLAVHELEVEFVSGRPQVVLAVADAWVRRHALWLDVCSKAERGDRLARGVGAPDGVKARPPQWPAGDALRTLPPEAALRCMLAAALQQVLANAADVADGDPAPALLHQLRVGLRRLRSLLRELHDWSPGLDPAWEPALAQAFGALGAARDRDALASGWMDALRAAGAPPLPPPAAADWREPGEVVREAGFQRLLLALLGFVMGGASAPPPAEVAAVATWRAEADTVLARLHRRSARDVAQFDTLDEPARHRLRKRLKRLRYVADALAPLYPRKRTAAYLEALREAQDTLGEANDRVTARGLYEAAAASEPRAWLAVGWLRGQEAEVSARSARALKRWARCDRFWRSR